MPPTDIRFFINPETGLPHIYDHNISEETTARSAETASQPQTIMKKDPNRYPKGWNRKRVREVIAYYDHQSDAQAIAEAEAAYKARKATWVQVPLKLLPQVRRILRRSA